MEEKYTLEGVDGNAFAVMGFVRQCMLREKFTQKEITEYLDDAKSSDYNHLLFVSYDMVEKCNERFNSRTMDKFELKEKLIELVNMLDKKTGEIMSSTCDEETGEIRTNVYNKLSVLEHNLKIIINNIY